MDTGGIRKWHIGLGLPIFTAILLWSYLSVDPMGATGRTTSPQTFEFAARGRPIGKTNPHPQVWNIKLYPPEDGVWTVTFMQLTPKRAEDAYEASEWSFSARNPRNGSTETIPDWLARLKAESVRQGQPLDFTYAWWREPRRMWTIWAVASALFALWGVIIPTILWFARGGLQEMTQKPKTPSTEPGIAAAARGTVTAADADKLDEMIDRLEVTTAGSGMSTGSTATANPSGSATTPGSSSTASPGTPKPLSGGPLEPSAAPQKEEEAKDFKGEFYPVAKGGHAPHGAPGEHH